MRLMDHQKAWTSHQKTATKQQATDAMRSNRTLDDEFD
jgi:hypothetical protein